MNLMTVHLPPMSNVHASPNYYNYSRPTMRHLILLTTLAILTPWSLPSNAEVGLCRGTTPSGTTYLYHCYLVGPLPRPWPPLPTPRPEPLPPVPPNPLPPRPGHPTTLSLDDYRCNEARIINAANERHGSSYRSALTRYCHD